MSAADDFQVYKRFKRQTFDRSPADVIDRWKSRVVAHDLHIQGRLGAEIFLKKFGRNITEEKAAQWALKAEIENCPEMADVLWEKAYSLKLNPPPHNAKSKKQQEAFSKNKSKSVTERESTGTGINQKAGASKSFPGKTDAASLRMWWHHMLQTNGKYTCCAFVLALPADADAIEYLTKFGKELHLLSRNDCLVLAISDTQAITYGVGEDEWNGAIHEQVGNGQSLEIARLFNINFAELPCMVFFRDIRSSEHLIVSLRRMGVDEISQMMRYIFSIIQSANSNKVDPLAELERHRKKQEFQKLRQSAIGEVRKYLDITFEAAMQAYFQSLGKSK